MSYNVGDYIKDIRSRSIYEGEIGVINNIIITKGNILYDITWFRSPKDEFTYTYSEFFINEICIKITKDEAMVEML